MTTTTTDKKRLRTPEHRFNDLPDYPYSPHYIEVSDSQYGPLRMHYVDHAGTGNTPVVLMLNGEPSWSYAYRKVIAAVADAGYRAVAPDHIGFGRSDKLPDRQDYSYQKFVDWMIDFVQQLDLHNIVLLCQDWGGPIGLRTLAALPDRFAAVIAANTLLPSCEPPPNGVSPWPGQLIEDWVAATRAADDLPVADIVNGVCVSPLSPSIKAAYDAPFPDASYKAAALEFPSLIPTAADMPGCQENRRAWQVLDNWHKPFVTAFSDQDPSTGAWQAVFQQRIPGADHHHHTEITGAGHFVQEEQPQQLAQVVIGLLQQLSPPATGR